MEHPTSQRTFKLDLSNIHYLHLFVKRPYPLQGRFMANLFVHFEPTNPNALLSDPPLYRRPMQQSKWDKFNLFDSVFEVLST